MAVMPPFAALARALRELPLAFSRSTASNTRLETALESVAREANALLGTRRVSIWLHDRRARALVLSGSSDGTARQARFDATDAEALPSRGLRLDRPLLTQEGGEPLIVAPLRGWRRALGALILEGPPSVDVDADQLTELATEFSQQLSAAIENVQLIEEVVRQRRLLEDTFNSLIDLVVVADNGQHVIHVNDAFSARVGESPRELVDRQLTDVIGPTLGAWVAGEDTSPAVVRTGMFSDEKLRGTFAATLTPLIKEDGEIVGRVLVARDVTVQARLEAEKEALHHRLVQSEKLASLGQFVAGITHEMNNPLQGALGNLELLMRKPSTGAALRRELRQVYRDADRAARIVRNLLVFAGDRRMARRRVRIDRVLGRALSSRRAALTQAQIDVVRDEGDIIPAVMGDPLLLQQAFLNLLINAEHAISATGRGGVIEIGIWENRARSTIVTTIRDDGPGFGPDVLPRIFDPFFTTKEVGQGTGLGLAITYGIIQEHEGTIQAANAPEGGAIFTVELPAAI